MAGGAPDLRALHRTVRALNEESVPASGGSTAVWAPDPHIRRGHGRSTVGICGDRHGGDHPVDRLLLGHGAVTGRQHRLPSANLQVRDEGATQIRQRHPADCLPTTLRDA